MSLPVLVPDHTGNSIYTTPAQSPSGVAIHDPFANPGDHNGYDPGLKDEEFKSSADAIYMLSQISANGSPTRANHLDISPDIPQRPPGQKIPLAPAVEDEKPSIPPRPAARETSMASKSEKEAPELPERPPSQLDHPPPKPKSQTPTRPPPSPLRKRYSPPSPPIPEETMEQVGTPALKYSRHREKLIAYLIPLPKPKLRKNLEREDDLPERYLLYTPPRPHLLKPVKGVKEKKRHFGRRKMEEQVEKATKYDGKTFSWRGLHGKTTKGVVWAVRRIRATDLVFLGRVKDKEVSEIILIYPSSVTQTIPEIRDEFIAQITRTKHRAAKQSAISTLLLPITLIIDTLAAVIWPFGGLFEIDAVWCYTATKGWYTSRKMTKRLGARESRFREYGGTERDLFLRFHQDPDIEVLRRYLAEACHKRNPAVFESAGVPPTETEVAMAIGWKPVARGKTGGKREEGKTELADEEWQRMTFTNDLKAVAEKAARSWERWGERFDKKQKVSSEADLKAFVKKATRSWNPWRKRFERKPDKAF